MRFRQLELIRYGHFTDFRLVFPEENGDFHIIVGPNEAGKSTALGALTDVLFGIEERTPYAFLHSYGEMLLGAEIGEGDRAVSFLRRKGRKDTLLDQGRTPLSENALRSFLSGCDRDLFHRMFGLDHRQLETGGRQILEAQDDVGRTLFEAGSGIAGIGERLEELAQEADALFGPRTSERREFYKGLRDYAAARDRLRDDIVTRAQWEQCIRHIESIETDLDNAGEKKAALRTESARLERIRRVRPILARLGVCESALATLAEVPDLPKTFKELVANTLKEVTEVRQNIAAARREIERLGDQIARIEVDETARQAQGRVDELVQLVAKAKSAEEDLPKRRGDQLRARKQVEGLLSELEHSISPDEAKSVIPTQIARQTINTLIREAMENRSRMTQAEKAFNERRVALEKLERRFDLLGDQPETAPLVNAVKKGRKCESNNRLVNELEIEIASLSSDLGNLMARLAPFTGDAEALARTPVPSSDTVASFREEFDATSSRIRDLAATIGSHEQRIIEIDGALANLKIGGDVPTDDVVVEARRRRDAEWASVKGRIVAGEHVPLKEADTFEQMVRDADSLVDRRNSEADRVANFSTLTGQRISTAQTLNAIMQQKKEAENERSVLEQRWAATWSELEAKPKSPADMRLWLETRKGAMRLLADLRQREERLSTLQDEERSVTQQIAVALTGLTGNDDQSRPFSELLGEAEATVDKLRQDETERRTLGGRLSDGRVEVKQAEGDLARARQEGNRWEERWRAALEALGRDTTELPETVHKVLELYGDLDKASTELVGLNHRIGTMEEDRSHFTLRTREVCAEIAPDLVGANAFDAVKSLQERVGAAAAAVQRRNALAGSLVEHKTSFDVAKVTLTGVEVRIVKLCEQARCEGEDDLPDAADRAQRKRDLEDELSQIRDELIRSGDGLDVEILRQEIGSVSPEKAQGRLEEIAGRIEQLDGDIARLNQEFQAARTERDRLRKHNAAEAAEDKCNAVALIRDAAERYILVRSAYNLLRWALERYRQQNRAPLLDRAGEFFRMLTGGSFAGLTVAYRENDTPYLVGRRSNDREMGVDEMSDGTRDQLYLALRLASVEESIDKGMALPFVADDLLVNFDNERAAATLATLAGLSQKTQVVFFTHHAHLLELAQQAIPGRFRVIHMEHGSG